MAAGKFCLTLCDHALLSCKGVRYAAWSVLAAPASREHFERSVNIIRKHARETTAVEQAVSNGSKRIHGSRGELEQNLKDITQVLLSKVVGGWGFVSCLTQIGHDNSLFGFWCWVCAYYYHSD